MNTGMETPSRAHPMNRRSNSLFCFTAATIPAVIPMIQAHFPADLVNDGLVHMLAQHGGDRIAGYDPQHDENNQDNAYKDRYGYQDSFQTFFKHWITPFFLLGVLSETTLTGKEVSEGTPD